MAVSIGIALIAAVTVLYVLLMKWRHQYWARKGVTQLKTNVITGDFWPVLSGAKPIKDFFLDIYKEYKPKGVKYIGLYNFGYLEFMPLDINFIKQIMTKDFNYFGSHGLFHHKKDPFSMHLFNLEGAEWKDRRVKLTPLFTTGKMKIMFDTVAVKTVDLRKTINKHIEANEAIDIKDTLARFTTDVIGSVAFGLDCNTLNEPQHEFREIGRKANKPDIVKFFLETIFPKEFLVKFGYHSNPSDVESYFTKVVKDTLEYREKNNVQRKDFIQLMLQLKNEGTVNADDGLSENKKKRQHISEQEIINEAFLFYLAGFETSSSTMTFALYELAQNLDIQEKLREEINEVLEKYNGNITYDGLMEMEYLDKVVKETLRKYPVVPIVPRECTKDYQIPGTDIIIEKGTRVPIAAIGLHLDPEFYPNPEEFNPENFSPEKKAARPDFAWMPFGEGPRQCIGMRFGLMQSKIGIVSLLNEFKFTMDKKIEPIADTGNVIYSFKENVMLRATKI